MPGSGPPTTALIARARRKLASWPHVRYFATAATLHVPAPNPGGFAVRLKSRRDRYIVQFDGWTRVFDRDDDALDCFELGLSDSCRLEVTFRGRTAVAWRVDMWEYGVWAPRHRTSRRVVPFWRTKHMEHRQNRVLTREGT